MEELYVRTHKIEEFKAGDVVFVCYSNYANRFNRHEVNLWLFEIRQLPGTHKYLEKGVEATVLEVLSENGALGIKLNTAEDLGELMIPVDYAIPSAKNMN